MCLPFRSQRQPGRFTQKQWLAEQFLKANDMAADRALRHRKRRRPQRETRILANGVERAQRVQWQPATVDTAAVGDDPGPFCKCTLPRLLARNAADLT